MVPANVNKQLMNHLPDRADLCVDPGNHLHRREESIALLFLSPFHSSGTYLQSPHACPIMAFKWKGSGHSSCKLSFCRTMRA